MHTKELYINLPVKDLPASIEFFRKLGFEFNAQFTDEKAACMIIGSNIYAMLLSEAFFKSFTKKEVCDTTQSNEVLLALSFDSREEVDAIVSKAREAGGKIPNEPTDHGWMYQTAFLDLDGHRWEPLFMEPNPGVEQ